MKDKFSIDIVIIFALVMCLILLLLDIYTGFYQELNSLGLTDGQLNRAIKKIYGSFPLISNSFFLRILILGVFMLGAFGISFKKKPEEDDDLKKYVVSVVISFFLFVVSGGFKINLTANILISFASWMVFIWSFLHIRKHFNFFSNKDEFNNKNLIFQQEKLYKQNPYSINLKTENGLINVVNPFRATMVLGTPGSGKSYSVIEEYIRQHIMKNFSMLVYDFKFPSLAKETYGFYEYYKKTYKVTPRFTVISLDDIEHSNFVNPISPDLIRKTADAIEASQTVLYNLNKEWITKKDFFAQSAISYFACCIYFLKLFEGGKFCTLPHAIALASCPDEKVFKIFQKWPELRFFMTPFADALEKQAYEQLSGQTATARIPLSQLATRELFWVMGNNVYPELNASLDVNNPEDPQIMILANSPTTQTTNSPALGLISTQLIKVVNTQDKIPCSIIIDELPTMYFMGLDNLIATARSNKVSTTIGAQDLEQLKRDYGDKVAETIFNIVGNIFSGSVRSGTATKLQEIFGKKKQRLKNMTVDTSTTSYTINESMDFAIPVSTISQLSQGEFVGIVADNFGEEIDRKVFRGHIKVDKRTDQIKKEIPLNINEDNLEELLNGNFKRIVEEIDIIIENELAEINKAKKEEEEKKEENNEKGENNKKDEQEDGGGGGEGRSKKRNIEKTRPVRKRSSKMM
ncbi:type IV secretory system conjugative DNA transfer family protein [Abyssalbus ytuae]|uniref:Type IV secretion system DNA-binding domain-containing protein n=1 Tax=Abyssalbus ytuae TaxID=2926907 RepID=A0A9E7D139_9FLAO|nr:type IV secretory system conjugative DNA transfer family protein [Abyssalbus ytuae]UOB16658.1 type IV secretion system DNA-binding domain-containing protein [Abyssalbus ytuae]